MISFAIYAGIALVVGYIANALRADDRRWRNQSIWIASGAIGLVLAVLAGVGASMRYQQVYGY